MSNHYIIKEETLTNIADNIREKLGTEDSYSPDDMASGVNEVYEAGDYNARLTVTKNISRGGKRTDYERAFIQTIWDDFEFIEGYIKPINANNMFYNYVGAKVPKGIDFSKVTSAEYCFCWSSTIKIIPDLGIPANVPLSRFVQHCSALETIEILRLTENTVINNPFQNCTSLKNITFEGVIGGSINFSQSPLTVESMKSIITHLKDYSGTTSEFTYTVTFKASAFEALEAEGSTAEYTDAEGNTTLITWAEYIDNLKWNLVKA